jgi:hypothetical protein
MSSDTGSVDRIDLRHSKGIVSVAIILILAMAGHAGEIQRKGLRFERRMRLQLIINAWDTCIPETVANNGHDNSGQVTSKQLLKRIEHVCPTPSPAPK